MDILSSDSPDSKPHYVYTLAYPESMGGAIFYVGKGIGKRIHQHEWEARKGLYPNSYKENVIRKIWSEGEQVVKSILAYFATHEEACLYEMALIFFMGRRPHGPLTNRTDGGEGTWGLKMSESTRQKMSAAHTGRKMPPPSDEWRRKMSESKKKSPRAQEHLRKLRELHTGMIASEETKLKMSQTRKGRPHPLSEEYTHKLIEMNKSRTGKPFSEEHLRKLSEVQKGRKHTEETRLKMSESAKLRWQSPQAESRKRALSEEVKQRNQKRREKKSMEMSGDDFRTNL